MPSFDARVYAILSKYITQFMDVIPSTHECPKCPKIKHVTVLSMEHESLGLLFDYCPIFPSSECSATSSSNSVQLPEEQRLKLRDELDALPNPPKLGGWLFLGAAKEMFKASSIPACTMRDGKKTLVEVLVFVKDWKLPVSLPLIADVVEDPRAPERRHLSFNFCQPITVQMFPAQPVRIGFTRLEYTPPGIHYYNCRIESWAAALGNVWARNIFTFPLPLTQIPVFKLADVTAAMYAEEYALGIRKVEPLCSMKRTFVPHLEFTWPTGLAQARSFIEADWTVGINESGETVATCSSADKDGYEVRVVRDAGQEGFAMDD